MNTAFSLLISAGIIAFGVWVVGDSAIAANSFFASTLMGSLAVVVGGICLFYAVHDAMHSHR